MTARLWRSTPGNPWRRTSPRTTSGSAIAVVSSNNGRIKGNCRGSCRPSFREKRIEFSFYNPSPPRTPVPFNLQPTLTGPLVTLRPLESADHDRLFAVASDPLIWEQHPDKTRCQPAGFRAFFQQALDSGGALLALETGSGRV